MDLVNDVAAGDELPGRSSLSGRWMSGASVATLIQDGHRGGESEATTGRRRPQRGNRPRVLHYCHDTYGLGHLRRTLKLAGHLEQRWAGAAQLIVTGSPMAQRFFLPAGTDYIKLPSVVKVGSEQYVPRSLPFDFAAIRDLRADILAQAVWRFRPDIFVVDHAPAGMGGEARGALRLVRQQLPGTRLILGLRDIVDEPAAVRRAWQRGGIYQLLDEVYDRIVVYGHPDICDVASEYGLSERAAAKVRYVGYLGQAIDPRSSAAVRAGLALRTDRLVVITAGGGEDGFGLLDAAARSLAAAASGLPFDCLLVTGPLLSPARRRLLEDDLAGRPGIHIREYVDDLPSLLAAADVIVSMGGYNTVCEILDSGRPAIVVPRAAPRREQLIRAEALSRRGLLRLLHPGRLTPERLLSEIHRAFDEPFAPALRLPMDGLVAMGAELASLLASAETSSVGGVA